MKREGRTIAWVGSRPIYSGANLQAGVGENSRRNDEGEMEITLQ